MRLIFSPIAYKHTEQTQNSFALIDLNVEIKSTNPLFFVLFRDFSPLFLPIWNDQSPQFRVLAFVVTAWSTLVRGRGEERWLCDVTTHLFPPAGVGLLREGEIANESTRRLPDRPEPTAVFLTAVKCVHSDAQPRQEATRPGTVQNPTLWPKHQSNQTSTNRVSRSVNAQ